ncbi:MAG: hypothetical protein CL881_09470 [Dehalococcoidia bacterium]|nr:hypothetical protein [Dehalococcoidia bacterium]|tara:strand:- start:18947 stop:19369 length:423 start_codon:yes stop_codon:yes gene_type:complete
MSCIAALKPIVAVNTSSNPKTKTKTTSSRVPPLRTVDRPNDFLSMAERVNGRAAMIGFTSAVIDEIMTGHSISTQFQENIGLSVAVAALVLIGTAANPKDEGYIQGFWKPETELVNGRLAMIGVLSLILTESLHPHVPLF